MWIHSGCRLPVLSSSTEKRAELFDETKAGAKYVYHVFVLQMSEMTNAQFNRRMRKTACPVVWKGHGVQLPVTPSDHRNGYRKYETALVATSGTEKSFPHCGKLFSIVWKTPQARENEAKWGAKKSQAQGPALCVSAA